MVEKISMSDSPLLLTPLLQNVLTADVKPISVGSDCQFSRISLCKQQKKYLTMTRGKCGAVGCDNSYKATNENISFFA